MNSELTADKLQEHFGHKVVIVKYGNQNISLECEDCFTVLADADIDDPEGTRFEQANPGHTAEQGHALAEQIKEDE